MRFDKMPQVIIIISIILSALFLSVPLVRAPDPETFTLDGLTITVTKTPVEGGIVYDGEVVADLYTEEFHVSSISINGVNETSTSLDIVGEDFAIDAVSVKSESSTGSNTYSLTSFTNKTGDYSVAAESATSEGVISGSLTQDLYAPFGKYYVTLTPLPDGSYKGWVTFPTGETIDPALYQFANAWHGPWWASYNLRGWILSWHSYETVTLAIIMFILNLISIFVAPLIPINIILEALLLVSELYTATVEPVHRTYWDAIYLYGVVPIYGEVGFYTNHVWSPWGWRYIPWTYIPQWRTYGWGGQWHTGVWPVGF